MKSKIFEKTYTTEVAYGKIEMTQGGFYDDDAGSFQALGTFCADVQPYNGGLAEKEYGQVGEVSLRVYYASSVPGLEIGTVLLIAGQYYTVTYVSAWESGNMALLRLRHDLG